LGAKAPSLRRGIMDFKGKPNSSITTPSGRLGKTDDKGFLTVPDELVLKQFQNRMARGGLRLTKIYTCKTCGEKFDDRTENMNHARTHTPKKVKK
jgi:hypothetical protein